MSVAIFAKPNWESCLGKAFYHLPFMDEMSLLNRKQYHSTHVEPDKYILTAATA